MWGRAALVGATGFVGGNLARQRTFAAGYHSRNIDTIEGETFDTLVCAAAPGTMWKANADPDADRAGLDRLVGHLEQAKIGRLILISTVAVYADPAGGDTEASQAFETDLAYGRNRRALEIALRERFKTHIVRLPALFGPGLRKNFIFDLMNPVPSFLKPERYAAMLEVLAPTDRALAESVFAVDEALSMVALDREALAVAAGRPALEQAVSQAGFASRTFTNSDSRFQCYDVTRLADDIETMVDHDLPALNVCSEPWRAGDLHQALTGQAFENTGPPVRREDIRSDHAGVFGRTGPYLFSREDVLGRLQAFVGTEGRA